MDKWMYLRSCATREMQHIQDISQGDWLITHETKGCVRWKMLWHNIIKCWVKWKCDIMFATGHEDFGIDGKRCWDGKSKSLAGKCVCALLQREDWGTTIRTGENYFS